MQELHNSTLYWLRAEYRQTGLAQDASPAIMMRDAMRKLSRRWRKKFDVLAGKLAERFA
ncbi:TPA: phage head morphogenesis protein, partial [Serratia marcescens]|nr:phage head morphogenesis protein [Serratia marcescens]